MTNKDFELNQNKNEEFERIQKQLDRIKVRLDNYDSLPCGLNLYMLLNANKDVKEEIKEILTDKLYKKFDELKKQQEEL